MSDGKTALEGVLQAHTLAMPALVNDMMWRHNVSVANDALEAAAALVETVGVNAATIADLVSAIRGLKVTA